MTERERIEAAIRAGCKEHTYYDPRPCAFPSCACPIPSVTIAAIRAYLAASQELSGETLGGGWGSHLSRPVGRAMMDAKLAEFDAAAAAISSKPDTPP